MAMPFLPRLWTVNSAREFIESHGANACPPATLFLRILDVDILVDGWACSLVDPTTASIDRVQTMIWSQLCGTQTDYEFKLHIIETNHRLRLAPGENVAVITHNMMISNGFCAGEAISEDVFYL